MNQHHTTATRAVRHQGRGWSRWRASGLLALLAIVVAAQTSAQTPAAQPRAVGDHREYLPLTLAARLLPSSNRTVAEAMFYNPVQGMTTAQIAGRARFVVVTGERPVFLREVRAAGYEGPILRYFIAKEVEGPGPYADASAPCDSTLKPLTNQVADQIGDFCTYIHPNEDWFLHNGRGERIYNAWFDGRITYHMNPLSPGWQAFARDRLLARMGGHDGIFFENVELSLYKLKTELTNSDGVVREFSTNDTYRAAMAAYLASFAPVRARGELWGNLLLDTMSGSFWDAYLPHLDGALQEAFATGYRTLTVTQWTNNLTQVEAWLNNGRGVVMVGRGEQIDLARQQFAFASYLLVTNNRRAYFRYAKSSEYSIWWDYDNYKLNLGTPKGKRYKSGAVWKRDFTCGTVTVDPAARTGTIVQTCP